MIIIGIILLSLFSVAQAQDIVTAGGVTLTLDGIYRVKNYFTQEYMCYCYSGSNSMLVNSDGNDGTLSQIAFQLAENDYIVMRYVEFQDHVVTCRSGDTCARAARYDLDYTQCFNNNNCNIRAFYEHFYIEPSSTVPGAVIMRGRNFPNGTSANGDNGNLKGYLFWTNSTSLDYLEMAKTNSNADDPEAQWFLEPVLDGFGNQLTLPTGEFTAEPTVSPTTGVPTQTPTKAPTKTPTKAPSKTPTSAPTSQPTTNTPTQSPSKSPTQAPVLPNAPTATPTTKTPTLAPTTDSPTQSPILPGSPTNSPVTSSPTPSPTLSPVTSTPTTSPTAAGTTSETSSISSGAVAGISLGSLAGVYLLRRWWTSRGSSSVPTAPLQSSMPQYQPQYSSPVQPQISNNADFL
jgi:hypothetical protein